MFELQCLALRKDSKMYKDRIEAILQQMEEVAIERDQVGTSPLPASCWRGAAQGEGTGGVGGFPQLWCLALLQEGCHQLVEKT